jgi:uncharacterized phiE125 gp8 family phage protein
MSTYLQIDKLTNDVVTLAEMKEWLKVTTSTDDAVIQSLIASAVNLAEKYMNRDILTTTYENYRDSFYEDLTLRRAGYQSIESIEYLKDNVYITLDANTYTKSFGGVYGVVCEIEKTPNTDVSCNAVKITFKTGFGDTASDVPEMIKTAIKMGVTYMYENRGDCCNTKSGFPKTAQNILYTYRVVATT